MRKACWAVYKHSVSTDDNPQHQDCPPGAESWCKYQRALANNQEPLPHNTRIPSDIIPWVESVFTDLCDDNLLQRCVLGATQNRNESFNAMIWARAPKTTYVQRQVIITAVSQAVLTFNSGDCAMIPVMRGLEIEPGELCRSYLIRRDRQRLYKAEYKADEKAKDR